VFSKEESSMANPKILVVDDDPDIVETLEIVLEAHDYDVITASNGNECLSKVKEANPDLIILDVMMDNLTEGFQVTYTLRNPAAGSEYAQYAKIPILMLTGVGKEMKMGFSSTKDSEYLPVDDFVEKPVRSAVLLEKVNNLLKKK